MVELAGPPARVVKRYNIKNPWHAMRRMLRFTPRYRRAWSFGQLLIMLDIPTARPLVLLEQRLGPLRGRASLLTEALEGPLLAEEIAAKGLTAERCAEVTDLFALLKVAGLTHGDSKSTNFVVHQGRVHLIDLDAMAFAGHGQKSDAARFLQNWPAPISTQFENAFRKAGLL